MSKFRILKDGTGTFYVEKQVGLEWEPASLGLMSLEAAEQRVKSMQRKMVKIIEEEDPGAAKDHGALDDITKLKLENISLAACNELLISWIKILIDPQKSEEKRAEIKEFLDSIHNEKVDA